MTDDIKQVGEAFVRTDLDDYGDDDRHRRDDVDPIVVADGGVRCEYCDQVFDRDAAATRGDAPRRTTDYGKRRPHGRPADVIGRRKRGRRRMNVDSDSVTVGVEFSHPTYLRILHYLDDDRDVGEWLKTLAWVQMQRDIGRYEVEVLGELPEDVVTNIQLYRQHMEEDDRDYALGDSIHEFVEMSFDELIDMNDLDAPDAGEDDE